MTKPINPSTPGGSDGGQQGSEELQRLRDLILGEEKDRLHKLDLRISDLESRTADVAEVLPAAMNRLVGDPVSQPEFEKPVVNTIRGAIKRDTESFAEALFPVLGPAIRRAVADALMGLVQRINVALENSFTVKGLKWRMEAARTGMPFAQIVLRHTMLYAVQEAFLIQRGSGLILSSVQRDESLALDEDAVAAMLTAIQSFIQDSFGISSDEPLRSAELGERTVWVINGPAAVLACVITGTPPRAVRDELMSLLETLHARFGARFSESPDGLARHEGLHGLLNQALREEVDESAQGATSFKYKMLWIAGGVALVAFLLYSSLTTWQDRQFTRQVERHFSNEPGYVITSISMDDGVLKLSGLRDPDSATPAIVLENHQIPAPRVSNNFSPYQSLENEIVVRRLERRFGLDPRTMLELQGDELIVSGTLSSGQLSAIKQLPESHVLVRSVNVDAVRLNGVEAAGVFRDALNAPESVAFVPVGARMNVSGLADGDWYAAARRVNVSVPGWQLDFQPLQDALSDRLDEVIQGLNGQIFSYERRIELTDESAARLESAAAAVNEARSLASGLGAALDITLEGSGDGSGNLDQNIIMSQKRSRHLLDELISRGVDAQNISQSVAEWDEAIIAPDRRKVTLLVERRSGS